MINIILTVYTLIKFGRKFIVNSFNNYWNYREMNMETLVALGSVAAFLLFIFFLVTYTLEYLNNDEFMKMDAMMNLLDALTSSTLIVIIVTIGKYL
jgi:cation transport ATPase